LVDLHRIFIETPPEISSSGKWEVTSCFAATDKQFEWFVNRKIDIIRDKDKIGWTMQEREEIITWMINNDIRIEEIEKHVYDQLASEKWVL
jgi:hypothetical protein